jgi:hypothetical protein
LGHTLISFTTLKALLYPPYENITRYSAIVIPYAVAVELPDQASLKFAFGLSTDVPPPKTTKPVMMTNRSVQILTIPTPFENQYAYFVLKTRASIWSDRDVNLMMAWTYSRWQEYSRPAQCL